MLHEKAIELSIVTALDQLHLAAEIGLLNHLKHLGNIGSCGGPLDPS